MATPSIPYGLLKERNPTINLAYWDELWALYAGGTTLLDDSGIMLRLFPRHNAEDPKIYRERKRRACYTNHSGALIDYVVAALIADQIMVEAKGKDGEFWEGWIADVSPPGGDKMTASQLVKIQIAYALIFRCSWTLVDLPNVGVELETEGEQEEAGALGVYAKPCDPRCVVDWEDGPDGQLEWVLLKFVDRPRESPLEPRIWIRERYYLYTRTTWASFEVKYHDSAEFRKAHRAGLVTGKEVERPEDKAPIPGTAGSHTFGRVPMIRTVLPEGLWAMNKLHSLARAYFNRESALGWTLEHAHFQTLYEFVDNQLPGIDSGVTEGGIEDNPDRALAQTRGIGYVQVRKQGDKAEYVGPDTSAFKDMMASMKSLRDELHRILYQLALAVENSAGAMARSGESKAQDKGTLSVILKELGRIGREFLTEVIETGAAGRGSEINVTVKGLEKFEDQSATDVVTHAMMAEGISIPSPTFQRKLKALVARVLVGAECSEEDAQTIEDELETFITADQFAQPFAPPDPLDEDQDDEQADTKPPDSRGNSAGAGRTATQR
jgi:hypothetical protein